MEQYMADAIAAAANVERANDTARIGSPAVASRKQERRFRHQVIAFLREMPEDKSIRELLDDIGYGEDSAGL